MDTVVIGGKELKVVATYGSFAKLLKKHNDIDKINDWNIAKYNEFIFDALWLILKRKFFLKPFVFKFRLKNKITIQELRHLQANIHKILLGHDESDEEIGLGKSHTRKVTTS